MKRKILLGLTVAGVLGFATAARAQDAEAAALFKAAKDLAGKGQWADACPKFDASYKREAALGTLMNLADCHEHTQEISRAWSEWNMAYELSKKAKDDERADLSKRRADALEPRMPKLKVVVTGLASDLTVYRDEKALDQGEYGVELPVDTGTRTVSVRRGTEVLEKKTISVQEKGHETVSFDLTKISADHPAPKTPTTTTDPKTDTKTQGNVTQSNQVIVQQGAQDEHKTPAQKVIANACLGIGLTGLVAGGAFVGVAAGLKGSSDCSDINGQTVCSPSAITNLETASTLATVGQWVMVGGGVLAATAIVLYIFMPKDQSSKPSAALSIAPTPGGSMFSFTRSF